MNFWTGLILGIIVGWLVEWLIDWLFWRRDAADGRDEMTADWHDTAQLNADLEAEWQGRLATAEAEYEARLAAVEAEWQSRLNLNEQQWQTQFTALEAYQADLHAEQIDSAAAATLAAAGVVPVDEFAPPALVEEAWDDEFDAPGGDVEMAIAAEEIYADPLDTRQLMPIVAADGAAGDVLPAGQGGGAASDAIGPDDLTRIRGIGPTYAARLQEHGIATFVQLAATDEATLANIIAAPAWRRIYYADWIAGAAELTPAGSD